MTRTRTRTIGAGSHEKRRFQRKRRKRKETSVESLIINLNEARGETVRLLLLLSS